MQGNPSSELRGDASHCFVLRVRLLAYASPELPRKLMNTKCPVASDNIQSQEVGSIKPLRESTTVFFGFAQFSLQVHLEGEHRSLLVLRQCEGGDTPWPLGPRESARLCRSFQTCLVLTLAVRFLTT